MSSLKKLSRRASVEKRRLNDLAAILYRSYGYEVDGTVTWDFEHSTHPQERSLFALATHAYKYFSDSQMCFDEQH